MPLSARQGVKLALPLVCLAGCIPLAPAAFEGYVARDDFYMPTFGVLDAEPWDALNHAHPGFAPPPGFRPGGVRWFGDDEPLRSRVGDLVRIQWGLGSDSWAPVQPRFFIALRLPEGWETVEGPTEYRGDVPPGGRLFEGAIRATAPGDWFVELVVEQNGHPCCSGVHGRFLPVAE